MTLYTCNVCKKEFNRKSSYDNHMGRKKPCKLDTSIDNQCSYCDKKYTTKFNLNKHINSCPKKVIDDDKQSQIDELKKLLLDQQMKIEELSKNNKEINHQMTEGRLPSGNVTVNDNSTTNNTTNNNIIIYNAGKEDLSRLSHEDILKICTSGTYYPIVAAEIIHCNDKYPEFQNFLISNLRSNDGKVLINDKWVTKSQDEILNTLMRLDKIHISTLMKDLKVDKKLQVKLESTQDEIDTNEIKEHMKPKIKQRLYDISKMIKKKSN